MYEHTYSDVYTYILSTQFDRICKCISVYYTYTRVMQMLCFRLYFKHVILISILVFVYIM